MMSQSDRNNIWSEFHFHFVFAVAARVDIRGFCLLSFAARTGKIWFQIERRIARRNAVGQTICFRESSSGCRSAAAVGSQYLCFGE